MGISLLSKYFLNDRLRQLYRYTLMIYEKRFLDEENQKPSSLLSCKVMVGRLVLPNAMIPPFPSLFE